MYNAQKQLTEFDSASRNNIPRRKSEATSWVLINVKDSRCY